MSGLLTSLILAAALSVAAAGLAWVVGLALQTRTRSSQPALWRSARLVAILPLLIAPILYAMPQSVPAAPALEYIDEPAAMMLASTSGSFDAVPAATVRLLPSLETLIVAIYALGLLVAGVRALQRHYRRRHLLNRSRMADRRERALLESEAGKLGVPAPELRISAGAASPFLTGWRGVIVAPESLLQVPHLARHALVHELCHLRRGDERDRLAGSALTILFWFNWPLRQIERELDAAREIACDTAAIEALGRTERKAYAATLIETMRSTAQPVSAFGPHDRRHREMRIKAILAGGRTMRHSLLTAGALLVLAIPLAGAQAAITPRRVVSAPVEQVTPALRAITEPTAPQLRQVTEPTAPQPPEVTAPSEPAVPAAPRLRRVTELAAVAAPAVLPAAAPALSQRVIVPDLSHPVVEGRVTSAYGARPAQPVGSPPFHGGTDIAAPSGTAIAAPGAGTVIHAEMGYQGSDRWGNTVEIDHGDGWSTVYAHLDAISVETGGTVSAGQQIGTVGTTGASSGPHLHVELHYGGERLDPADHLSGLD